MEVLRMMPVSAKLRTAHVVGKGAGPTDTGCREEQARSFASTEACGGVTTGALHQPAGHLETPVHFVTGIE